MNLAPKIEVCHSMMSASRPLQRMAIYDRFVSMSWMEIAEGSLRIDGHTSTDATTPAYKTSSVRTRRELITSDQRRGKRSLHAITGVQISRKRTLFREVRPVLNTVLCPLKVSNNEGLGDVIQFGDSPSLSKSDLSMTRGWRSKSMHCRDVLMDKRRRRALEWTSTLPVCVVRRNDIEVTA